MMEADCRNHLRHLTSELIGGFGLFFSNWDNRKGYYANLEPSDRCPQPAETCENTSVQLGDMKMWSSGYTEDPTENYYMLDGITKDGDQGLVNEQFYVNGFKATYIETSRDKLTLGLDNHAFIH